MMPFSCAASSASAICCAIAQRLDERDRPAAQAIGEVLAFDQLHDQRAAAAGFLETVDAGDVRVTERREHLRLAMEARHAVVVVREVLGQQLQRHVAVQARVGRAEHLSHAASPELAGDAIVRKGFTNHVRGDSTGRLMWAQ